MVNSEKLKEISSSKGLKLEGEVISSGMQKTIVVKVNRRFRHSFLGKTINKSKKYKVHDANEQAKIGDWVEIISCRPISKTKKMVLGQILRSAK
ncbi:30S ribosomal protein S17 [Candidatus Dependentiae bacterium]|nr:30S ribosomal protein S17 [Candidatus Dependentiae bacterium]